MIICPHCRKQIKPNKAKTFPLSTINPSIRMRNGTNYLLHLYEGRPYSENIILADVIKFSAVDYLRLPNFGRTTLTNLENKLAVFGLKLSETSHD